jgi:2-oxoglutarate dehydrogenase E2 component (dihydrolipoamide succinyltransferase)
MPQLGESIVEATVASWRVKPGDRVDRGQILAEVETDKATIEIPAPAAGVIAEILVPAGRTVPIGVEILRYQGAVAAEARPRLEAVAGSAAEPPPAPRAEAARLPSAHLAPRPIGADGRERRASPAVRRIARLRGIDLDQIAGSGGQGRITREDLLVARAAPRTSHYRPPAYDPQPGDQVVPFSRRRAFIAEHMVYSLGTAAHVAAVVEIDMGRVLAARSADRAEAERHGVHLTITAYVVRAIGQALSEHPELNATVRGESLVIRRDKNIGVAVDTPEGLIVPVIRRADELGLIGLARAIAEKTDRARAGTLGGDDLAGGSFTLSNPGRDGNLFGISIIRQPEVAILRIGEITKRAVVREVAGEDAILIRPMMYAALSYDHRVIDGSKGNAFLHRVKALLEGL